MLLVTTTTTNNNNNNNSNKYKIIQCQIKTKGMDHFQKYLFLFMEIYN